MLPNEPDNSPLDSPNSDKYQRAFFFSLHFVFTVPACFLGLFGFIFAFTYTPIAWGGIVLFVLTILANVGNIIGYSNWKQGLTLIIICYISAYLMIHLRIGGL